MDLTAARPSGAPFMDVFPVVGNPDADAAELAALLSHRYGSIRYRAAAHENVPAAALVEACGSDPDDVELLSGAAGNAEAPPPNCS